MQKLEDFKPKLIELFDKYNQICDMLTYEEVLLDKKLFLKLEKDKQILQPIALKYENYLKLDEHLKELDELIDTLVGSEREMFVKERDNTLIGKSQLINELQILVTQLNGQIQNITIEIVGAKGQLVDENISILIKGYSNFCANNNFLCEIEEFPKGVLLNISGVNAKEIFKKESGMQSIKFGLNEANYCVFIYDKIRPKEIKEDDIIIETCRSSGAGGQHINTTDSAIKATHIETGITATCQDERSQLQNKAKALENLKIKVQDHYERKIKLDIDNEKKKQLLSMRGNRFYKVYDINNNVIYLSNKQSLSLDDFMSGHAI